jgi:hypothetical protein
VTEPASESVASVETEPPGRWTFMVDPAWRPAGDKDEPPWEAVVGGWFVQEDGEVSLFRPNPSYQPSRPDLPTDPLDVSLQLRGRGNGDADDVLAALQDVLLGVAVDEQGMALVAPAPDDVLSVLVTTAPRHRARVDAAGWRDVTLAQLAEALPTEGVDVLLNPGAPASMRLTADTVRRTVAETETATGPDETGTEPPAGGEPPHLAERPWRSVVAEAGSYDEKSWRVAGKILLSMGIRADADSGRAWLVEELRQVVAAELARNRDHKRASALADRHGVSLGLKSR